MMHCEEASMQALMFVEDDGPVSFKRRRSTTSASSVKNTVANSRRFKRPHVEDDESDDDSSDDDEKPLALRKKVHAERRSKLKRIKKAAQPDDDSSEEDDKQTLATRFRNPNNNAASESRGGNVVSDDDDLEEDKLPLAARFSQVAAGGASSSASISNSKNNKLLVLPNNNSPRNSIKRPAGVDSNNLTSSAALLKKAKLPSYESSKSKPPATAKNVVRKKKSPSSFNKDNQKMKLKTTKITVKKSQLSKTMNVRQGSGDGKKWSTLEHNGVIFPPPYKPHGVKMLYNGQPVDLTPEQEEVATMFAVMKDTEYASKETFINNFFTDWRKILGKTHIICKFELCDFTPIYEWHLRDKEKKKQMTSKEKKALQEEKLKQEEKFMWAVIDGVKEKVGNFRVEPPGLFRPRGEHPKMGRLKRRIRPSDITINIGKGIPVPVCPIPGESWKEVKHDNTVTWLAFWKDPISQKGFKYVFLGASSSLKGQSDKEKYEKARKLKDHIDNIRVNYTKDFRIKDQAKKQIAVATYLIDKLALRAGNEKDDDEAVTVGCCTLKIENVTSAPPNKLQFDFLGKDSIRYLNTVEVELPVYEAIKEFCAGKNEGGYVFDKIDTPKLNAHLKDLMPGLTAKVFRTYNASITLEAILNKETEDGALIKEKVGVYGRANKEVAVICNHQRVVSKSHYSQMTKLNENINELKAQRDALKADLEKAKRGEPQFVKKKKGKPLGDDDEDGKQKKRRRNSMTSEAYISRLENKISKIETKIEEKEMDRNKKEDLKTVALGTSKINYLDPRITVAWCKTHKVPIGKIFNKTTQEKFGWARDVDPDFRF